jgi:hypothetical protein
MAEKKNFKPPVKGSKPSGPPASTTKANASKPAAQKSSAGKKPPAQKPGRKPTPKPATSKSSAAPRASSRAVRPIRPGISLDRKLDIVGISLALGGYHL